MMKSMIHINHSLVVLLAQLKLDSEGTNCPNLTNLQLKCLRGHTVRFCYFSISFNDFHDAQCTRNFVRVAPTGVKVLSLVIFVFINIFRPTVPPSKQANKSLLMKAVSEAKTSIEKTTKRGDTFILQT